MRLAILSPSGSIEPAYIEQASSVLCRWGHTPIIGAYACAREGRFAGTDEERLCDLHAAFADPEVDAVFCARGGYGLQRIIDKVGKITKPIVGFSDITCLHMLALLQGVSSLHAPMCKAIATQSENEVSLRYLRRALEARVLRYELAPHSLNRRGVVCTSIVGGNLSVLYGLQGTPYGLSALLPKMSTPPILFIEDIAERHYHIDRMLHNFRLSGVFEHIGALLVGQFTDCVDDVSMGCGLYDSIRAVVEDYDFPIAFGFPAGHGEVNLPLWFHTKAEFVVTEEGGSIVMESGF